MNLALNSTSTTEFAAGLPNPSGVRSNARIRRHRSREIQVSPAPQGAHQVNERKPDGAAIKEFVRLAQHGDAAAFEALYQLYSRRVYSLCLRMLNDPVEAEDLTQEAFLQLFRKIHTFRGESAFSSWLHRLTANLVLMRFRKKKAPFVSLDDVTRDGEENARPALEIGVPDLQLAGVFDRANLRTAIGRLPEGYRLMFILHDVYGYEHNEIGQMLGCSIGNSKSQLHKARKRLRELLAKVSTRIDDAASASLRSQMPSIAVSL